MIYNMLFSKYPKFFIYEITPIIFVYIEISKRYSIIIQKYSFILIYFENVLKRILYNFNIF